MGPDGTSVSGFLPQKWSNGSTGSGVINVISDRYTNERVEEVNGAGRWGLATPDLPEEIIIGAYINFPPLGSLGLDNSGTGTPIMGAFDYQSGDYRGLVALYLAGRGLKINSYQKGTYIVSNVLNTGWNLVELKCKVHVTTGYIYLYVNGVEVFSITGIDTRFGGYNIRYAQVYHSYAAWLGVGDIYVCDTSGSTNNDVLGPFHVQGILPDANGDSSDWTPSAVVDNYTVVNEDLPSEADYVESGTSTDQDLYNYEPLTGTWDSIFGLQMNSRLLLDVPGSEDVAVSCLSNVTQSDETFAITDSTMGTGDEELARRILETDPDTAVAWTQSGVDAIQGGVKFI
jgi:hypothetical protein